MDVRIWCAGKRHLFLQNAGCILFLTVDQLALKRGSAGVPWSPPLLRGRRGTMKGSDVRPGVPLASLGLRLFCVAGVGQCALPRGRMYAPGFRWRPLVSASFAWQAWDNVHCQGVGCTPRGSAGVPWSPPLLRGRRGTMCIAKGSDVRPGVPLASLGLRLFCVAGVGQCALPRGRMYAPGFRWRPLVSASFAWQAWDNVHCQGVGCTPRGSAGVPWSPPLLRGRRGTMCTAKGSDVRPGVPLASLGLRLFCVAGVGQCALPRGRMCAPAWDNVHCQGVGCAPRGSAGVPWSPPLLRGRRGTMCTAKGSDVRPGVPLASLGLRLFCVAGVGQCALTYSLHPSLTHSLTPSLTHSLTHSHTSLTHSLTSLPFPSLRFASLHFTSLHFTPLTLTSLTHTHHTHITHSHSHSLTVHEHTYMHTNSPTITAPSLLYFLFPSCFSMVSLSLKKLVTCGVIRSFNFLAESWFVMICA